MIITSNFILIMNNYKKKDNEELIINLNNLNGYSLIIFFNVK